MENARFNNSNINNTEIDGEEEAPFEFKNLLAEMFMTSFPNQSSSLEIPKIAISSCSPSSTSTNSSSSSQNNIISFGNPESNYFLEDNDNVMMMSSSSSSISSSMTTVGKRICRSPLQSQDHLLAERKRRERFAQLFAVLAKTIPALKKLDKASILEDAIKYIGELQERVRALEEAAGRNLIESTATAAQKQHYSVAANTSSCDDNSFLTTKMNIVDDESKRHENHDIKVQILDKNVLIGIHCNKQMRSIFSTIAGIMEKLHLTIHHIRVTPTNHTTSDFHYISILAEIDENVDIKVGDVEKEFEFALLISTPHIVTH
ncbi:hypothetical protein HAX54_012727 [Datura stramonium]|uniref:BHLH domain-containing protein n=1 Tax=Datura stramonium TaxID=4076 RepID=A0ABS8TM17_DATST|nr:hypothetical protein [Datura stramonium]